MSYITGITNSPNQSIGKTIGYGGHKPQFHNTREHSVFTYRERLTRSGVGQPATAQYELVDGAYEGQNEEKITDLYSSRIDNLSPDLFFRPTG